ncbi:MAG: hypothetical protein KDB00_23975 [Planctomycetales bacterium]|nr:hypothetical protein [Planctomycetales bacterium]
MSICDISCSFVQTSIVVFDVESPFVEFLVPDDDLIVGQSVQIAAYQPRYWQAMRGGDSVAHCASLCTWQL